MMSQDLYSEICTLQQRLTSQAQDSGHHALVLPVFLQSALSNSLPADNLVTPELCIQRLAEVTQNTGLDAGPSGSCLLSGKQRVQLGVVKSLLICIKLQQPDRWEDIVERLVQDCLPVEVLWQLHDSDILPLWLFLDRIGNDRGRCVQLMDQLTELCVCQGNVTIRHNILSAVCSHLVKTGFPEKKSDDGVQRKVCMGILDGVTRGLLDRLGEDREVLLPAGVLSQGGHVSDVCFKKFCVRTISVLMSHRPSMKVSEALKRQTEWKSAKVPDSFKHLYKQLLVPFDSGEVLEMLSRILEKQEVNWQTLLSFLATFLVCFPSASSSLQDHISSLLSSSLPSGDTENTIVAFLLARQSCVEGAHVFPTYPQWFQQVFGDGARSPAASKKAFTFLIKFLTDLVPFDLADILKVHILRPPFIPGKCRDLWTDYVLLAKTRLADLKVPLEENSTAIYTDHTSTAPGTGAAAQDVEKALASFEMSGKLPTTVMEASIFRKPYFVGTFLPALLQPRHLPDVPDTRMKLIEALKKAGKMPSSLFSKYEEACRRETRQLLEGVFEMEEDDGEEEMMMEPLEALSHRLKHLSEVVLTQAADARISELMSVVSERLEGAVGRLPQAELSGAQSSDVCNQDGCVIDVWHPDLHPAHVQVVDELLNCVCHTVHGLKDVQQLSWLHQLAQMLSQHSTLLPALLLRLQSLLQHIDLSDDHIVGVAAFVFHLCDSASLYPPVFLQHHHSDFRPEHCDLRPENSHLQQQVVFLPYFLSCLPVSSGPQLILTHRFLAAYLRTAFLWLHGDSAQSCDMAVLLPPSLLTLFSIITWRLHPETRPSQHAPKDGKCQREASQLGEDREGIPGSGMEPAEQGSGARWLDAVAMTIYKSDKFKEVSAASAPSLEDWLHLELRVIPAVDCLDLLQRLPYQQSVFSHFIHKEGKKESGQHPGLYKCCTVLLTSVITALSGCRREASRCTRCQQRAQEGVPGTGVSQDAVQGLMVLLSKAVQNFPPADGFGCGLDYPQSLWLVQQVLTLCGSTSNTSPSCLPHAGLRVVLTCPAYLLFCDSLCQDPVQVCEQDTVRFLEQFLVAYAAEGGVLSLDVICHLLQGYTMVSDRCTDRKSLKTFEGHPLVILSTLMHLADVQVLVPSLFVGSSPWCRLSSLYAAVTRSFSEGQLSVPQVHTVDSFSLAAATLAVITHRGCMSGVTSTTHVLSQMQQAQPKVMGILCELLLVCQTGRYLDTTVLNVQIEVWQQWLSAIWQQFPPLIARVGASSCPQMTSLRQFLVSADKLTFTDLVVLRCVGCIPPQLIAGEKGVVKAVLQLLARLCHRFDDAQTSSQVTDVGSLMSLSTMAVSLLRAAPGHVICDVDADELEMCGLEVLSAYHQRMKTHT